MNKNENSTEERQIFTMGEGTHFFNFNSPKNQIMSPQPFSPYNSNHFDINNENLPNRQQILPQNNQMNNQMIINKQGEEEGEKMAIISPLSRKMRAKSRSQSQSRFINPSTPNQRDFRSHQSTQLPLPSSSFFPPPSHPFQSPNQKSTNNSINNSINNAINNSNYKSPMTKLQERERKISKEGMVPSPKKYNQMRIPLQSPINQRNINNNNNNIGGMRSPAMNGKGMENGSEIFSPLIPDLPHHLLLSKIKNESGFFSPLPLPLPPSNSSSSISSSSSSSSASPFPPSSLSSSSSSSKVCSSFGDEFSPLHFLASSALSNLSSSSSHPSHHHHQNHLQNQFHLERSAKSFEDYFEESDEEDNNEDNEKRNEKDDVIIDDFDEEENDLDQSLEIDEGEEEFDHENENNDVISIDGNRLNNVVITIIGSSFDIDREELKDLIFSQNGKVISLLTKKEEISHILLGKDVQKEIFLRNRQIECEKNADKENFYWSYYYAIIIDENEVFDMCHGLLPLSFPLLPSSSSSISSSSVCFFYLNFFFLFFYLLTLFLFYINLLNK